MPTVTGTENLLMAASLAKGRTVIENAAREPEVEELARVLNKMGARIQGAGTAVVDIEGVDELHPVEHAIIPDRIEAGTFMVAAAVTRGDVFDGITFDSLQACAKLREAGLHVERGQRHPRSGHAPVPPVDTRPRHTRTSPTDGWAQLACSCARTGRSVITETIFENRFMHVSGLNRMGAKIGVSAAPRPWKVLRSCRARR
jgi:UDP-N-acetylglucosamine 1-carboxyvinyltransferase